MPDKLGDTGRPQPAEGPLGVRHAAIAGEPRRELGKQDRPRSRRSTPMGILGVDLFLVIRV